MEGKESYIKATKPIWINSVRHPRVVHQRFAYTTNVSAVDIGEKMIVISQYHRYRANLGLGKVDPRQSCS